MAKYKGHTYMHIYLEENLKNILVEEAKKQGLSLNAYIRFIILNRKV